MRLSDLERKYSGLACARLGHLWRGMGFSYITTHQQCERCGISRTVKR